MGGVCHHVAYDEGMNSVAATHALEGALQALIVGMRLDAIYAEHPEARPTEEEIAEMAERAGFTLP